MSGYVCACVPVSVRVRTSSSTDFDTGTCRTGRVCEGESPPQDRSGPGFHRQEYRVLTSVDPYETVACTIFPVPLWCARLWVRPHGPVPPRALTVLNTSTSPTPCTSMNERGQRGQWDTGVSETLNLQFSRVSGKTWPPSPVQDGGVGTIHRPETARDPMSRSTIPGVARQKERPFSLLRYWCL